VGFAFALLGGGEAVVEHIVAGFGVHEEMKPKKKVSWKDSSILVNVSIRGCLLLVLVIEKYESCDWET
jgi:hypothetical protein